MDEFREECGMRYRAILHGVDPAEKVQQGFGETMPSIREWAVATLSRVDPKYKQASVVIQEQVWQLVDVVRP